MNSAPEITLSLETASKLLELREDGELDVGRASWLRIGPEFKFSPRGVSGDYDTDCQWWDREEVEAVLESGIAA